jgi:CheY-like chemotaxis protein
MFEQSATATGDNACNLLWSERPLRILLAEDHSSTQETMLKMLSSLDYQADVAANGLEVMEAIGRQAYDVVLMSVCLPEMDGFQAARMIRAHTESPMEPWIVALTAEEDHGDHDACLAAGMNDFLLKPVQIDDLASLLGHVVADHAAQFPEDPAPSSSDASSRTLHFVDRDHAQPALEAYLADARTALSELVAYAGTHDFDAVRRKAHCLRGSSMIVGASRVTGLCNELEARATAQQPLENVLEALWHALESTATVVDPVSKRSNRTKNAE